MNRVDQYLAHKLEQRKLEGNLRKLTTHKEAVDLFSNDYLGIATSGLLNSTHDRGITGNSQYSGSTGSRLLSGNSSAAEALEKEIARFHHGRAALLFNSGYDANAGLLSSIPSRNTTILSDELCHASIIDGIRLSQCSRKYKFDHNDLSDLEEKLKKFANTGPTLVIAESVYSMDGDMAPLCEMTTLCETYNAQLIIDEAHATGVFGKHGEGLVSALGLQSKVFARVHTFGKALGCHGAAVVGGELLKQYLINFARSFIYTTALPGHTLHNIHNAYQHLAAGTFTNEPLHKLITHFRQCVKASGNNDWKDSLSPIQALVMGNNDKATQTAAALQHAGLQVKPILSPAVPHGMERLRVCLHTFNTKEQIDLLFKTLTAAIHI